MNAVGGEHTILVDGKLTEVQEIPSDFTKSMADFLTIKGTSSTSMIDANNNGPALTISTEVPVKIVNFTIKNGKTDSRGGGIYIDEKKADVTLGDGTVGGGVLITANEAKDGGGIYNNGKLTMKYGASITGNFAKTVRRHRAAAEVIRTRQMLAAELSSWKAATAIWGTIKRIPKKNGRVK